MITLESIQFPLMDEADFFYLATRLDDFFVYDRTRAWTCSNQKIRNLVKAILRSQQVAHHARICTRSNVEILCPEDTLILGSSRFGQRLTVMPSKSATSVTPCRLLVRYFPGKLAFETLSLLISILAGLLKTQPAATRMVLFNNVSMTLALALAVLSLSLGGHDYEVAMLYDKSAEGSAC